MAESKNRKSKRRGAPKHAGKAQLVVTLDCAKGDVVKVESVEASGTRQEITEAEFAELVGKDEVGDLEMVLEEAYAAGIEDGFDESSGADFDDNEDIEHSMLRAAEARRFLRHGVRRLVLLRALKRGLARRSDHNGVHTASGH
jgi:hypothetical protein